MTKERFEKRYNVKTSDLQWEKHKSGLYNVACIGPFAVYENIQTQELVVVRDNSIWQWAENLALYL